jgi:hypothetical protein
VGRGIEVRAGDEVNGYVAEKRSPAWWLCHRNADRRYRSEPRQLAGLLEAEVLIDVGLWLNEPMEKLDRAGGIRKKSSGVVRLSLGVKDRKRLGRGAACNGRNFQLAEAPFVDLMTPAGSLQLDRDPKIFRLWARWVPRLRARRVHAAEIPTLRDEHARWVERLLRVGLSTAEIKRTRLDTPLLPVQEREEWLLDFLAKRAKRQAEGNKKARAAREEQRS